MNVQLNEKYVFGLFYCLLRKLCLFFMKQVNPATEVVQVSITMERQFKERYAKLAVSQDMTLSQMIRLALRKFERGIEKKYRYPD